MLKRILKVPEQSFFLLGPRGSGKSTWLRSMFSDAHVIDLLSEETYQRLLSSPGQFADELRSISSGRWVIVDEVQRLPDLLNEVHRLMEEKRLNFVLCGSSARKLKRSGVNLLAGRALRRSMHPFVPEELGEQFDLEEVMRYGSLPIVWDSTAKQETLSAHAQLYLKEEIQAEALVRNLPGFARFLPIAALFHGQNINVTNIAREAGVARTTVAGYLDILEETLLCFRLPAYEAKLRVRERKLPKWYWCDPGIVRTMKRATGTLVPEEKGALFEGMVAQLLRAYKDYRGMFDDMYYWAPSARSGMEVDFVLTRGSELVAVEVKSGNTFTDAWCKGLRAIEALKGLQRRIVVYPRGPAMRTRDRIDILSFKHFSDELAAGAL
ncbi:MAG: ATP-binding protein [Proteobacteria bacterium]|nr:ATP-binding protein [Desulfobacterales bacterium]MBL7174115.1 ATP-binding protein [Desulfobacteraceae bacterium]MBU0734793.1 ATP-binding protein [Pseudomonadota bacterium]MBU1902868.1 ATP-binding protein [Pseudomonadota bacterium]